ncbi:MAG: Spy/CpxP family protein refolding chaperone [Candidatus Zixiibacteriota bacterium]
MRKLGLAGGIALLLVLLAFTWTFAQMETEKRVIKVMGDEMSMKGGCGGHKGGVELRMGGCGKGGGMMHQMGCGSMGSGMRGCGKMGSGMGMCGEMMGGDQGMGCCKMDFFLCCKKELELTDKQMKDLKAIKMDFQKGKIRTEADLKIAELELKGLMHDDDAPIKDIEAKMKAAAKLKVDMHLSHIKAFRKAKALLTPEQMEKMKKCMGK